MNILGTHPLSCTLIYLKMMSNKWRVAHFLISRDWKCPTRTYRKQSCDNRTIFSYAIDALPKMSHSFIQNCCWITASFTSWPPPSIWPHLFCGAGHGKRRGEQLKWSLAFRLYIGSFPCVQLPGPIHTARLGWVCFYI